MSAKKNYIGLYNLIFISCYLNYLVISSLKFGYCYMKIKKKRTYIKDPLKIPLEIM